MTPMTPTELQTAKDVVGLIMSNATSTKLGHGTPSSTLTSVSGDPTELILSYPDGRKFVVQVSAVQLNKHAGLV